MALTKVQKQKIVEDLKEKIAKQKAIILVGITGMKVKEIFELRKQLKKINANIQVVKKTLAQIVLKEKKLEFDKKQFKTELALVFGFGDEIAPAKTIYQFSQGNENLKILGGFLENKLKTAEDMLLLAQLPSREELLARMVWTVASPISGLVNVLQGNIKGLIYALNAIKK
ncbi:MAG: 50S ribosomal protein L10 [Candidatus Nealsonbacteria bacterium RBG_13_42_11]|uniref:Large ribosomal subunit protein uL10 n=1 Tax=Candidatus Nealsonbacteria bacterium RBG_13_42_11 TaxID=1801663 RepID=A0A1G2DYB5_9BACT|nr:MAG: 50S ribosomal protein L10 [Candidatus Nealsonbacteria bacterium RBG_13_42_11]